MVYVIFSYTIYSYMRRWMFFTQADCVTIGTQVMREVRMFDEKLLNKAEALYIRCRLDEAFPLFMELAGAGCGRAMYFLGEYYNHGLGSIKDRNETEARYWHGKGAAVGELLSQLNLAYMEDPRSEERAVLCRGYFPSVVKAAEAGDIVAADELGDMYLYGFGVEKSGKQAVFWLEKGAEKGYWRSLNALGDMYRLGEEVEEDGKKHFPCTGRRKKCIPGRRSHRSALCTMQGRVWILMKGKHFPISGRRQEQGTWTLSS